MKKCINGNEVKVLRSGAGYYIGTADEFGSPNCRISANYYKKSEDAQKELDGMYFIDRGNAMENQFCNGGCGCMIKEVEA